MAITKQMLQWLRGTAAGLVLGAALGGWPAAQAQVFGDVSGSVSGDAAKPLSAEAAANPYLKQTRSQVQAQAYRNGMLAGYSAAERQDYHTALINFRRALAARPGDRYATAAIRNMESYIATQRREAAKLAEIEQLQVTLTTAVGANDWACAAASVDRLVQLIPPDSSDRPRLIAYRGEITGFIQERNNLDQWSTVCPGGQV